MIRERFQRLKTGNVAFCDSSNNAVMNKFKEIAVDTNIFINPDAFRLFGRNPKEALCNFIDKSKEKEILIYMPPSIFSETMRFIEGKIPPATLSYISRKPPKKYEIFVPAMFLYELTEEIRLRINKGLRIAEKYTRYGSQGKKDENSLIKSLRDEFRVALREGIIDSKQDIDLIILAKGLNTPILSADQGLIKWADKLGVESLDLNEIKEYLFPTRQEIR